MNDTEIIYTENLTKKFSSFVALENLNLKIKSNMCIGFLGPNGAGKTTTIKILTGLIRPTSGFGRICGFDVTKETRAALQNVGAVVETPELYPNLTPHEILSYFGKLRGMSNQSQKERIKEVLNLVEMVDWTNKKIGTFSKGMKQRIGLAAALLHNPPVVILDEPTAGLDPRGIILIRKIIKSLKKEDKTIFLSSHLLSEVQEICDQVAVINKGRLLRFDSIQNIGNLKDSKIKIQFTEQPNQEQLSLIKNISGIIDLNEESPEKYVVRFEGSSNERADLLKRIQEIGPDVVSFAPFGTELESLYLDLVSDSGDEKNE
jgi:ABC-2 type transport system ATP-binding protein